MGEPLTPDELAKLKNLLLPGTLPGASPGQVTATPEPVVRFAPNGNAEVISPPITTPPPAPPPPMLPAGPPPPIGGRHLSPAEHAQLKKLLVPGTYREDAPPPPAAATPRGSAMGGILSLSSPRGAYDAAARSGLVGLLGVTPQSATQQLAAPGGASAAPTPQQLQSAQALAQQESKDAAAAGASAGADAGAAAASSANDDAGAGASLGYPPAQVIPGGWQDYSRVGRLNVPDDVKRDAENGLGLQELGVEQGSLAGTEQARGEQAVLQKHGRWLQGVDNQVARNEGDRQAKLQSAQIKLEELTDRVNNGEEISADRFWAKRSTGAKMLAILGVALGGFAAGMRGGENQAMGMLEREMDRDLEAQKAQAANARGKLSDQRGLLSTMKENFGDARQAEVAAKSAYLTRAELDLKGLAAQSRSKEVQARATELLAGIQQRRAELGLKFAELEQGKLTETYRPAQVVGGAPAPNPERDKLFVPTGPNGQGYYAKTEDEAKKGRALRTAVAQMDNVLNKAQATRQNTSAVERFAGNYTPLESEDYSTLDSLSGQAVLSAKNAEEMGALDKGAAEYGGKVVGNFSRTGGHPEAAGRAYQEQLHKKLAEFERSQAGQGARQLIAHDAQGNPVATTLGQRSMASPRGQMPSGFKPVAGAAPAQDGSPQQPYTGVSPLVVSPSASGGHHRRKKAAP